MSTYTGQFGKALAMLGQFQFAGVPFVGLAGASQVVSWRERWARPSYAVTWVDPYRPVAWKLRARRMTNV